MQSHHQRKLLGWSREICIAFHVPWHCFQEDLLHDLSQHKGETDRLVVPQVFLKMDLLKNGCGVALFFQSPGTLPDCHEFSNIIESGLAIKSDNSLRTVGYISSGPIDLWIFRFLR